MTRMRRIWLASVVVAIGALLGICSVDLATAAKPGGGTHSSRIYYRQFSPAIDYQMYEDGSNKVQVASLSGVVAVPNNLQFCRRLRQKFPGSTTSS